MKVHSSQTRDKSCPGPNPWKADERAIFAKLTTPAAIQAFLDTVPYSADPIYRCPRRVLADRKAHCFDGALFAAAALRRIGHPPRIIDILAERDDDHLLAIYQTDGHYGAIAKSNFVGLRFREPVFKTLRELVLSYFENYYNVEREKTMRGYTVPLALGSYDDRDWMIRDEPLDAIAADLDRIRRVQLLTPAMAARLLPVDPLSYQAGMLGTNPDGLWRPDKKS